MATSKTHRLLLWAAATDHTFEEQRVGPSQQRVLSGKCIHCGRRHTLTPAGEPLSSATIEHIVPKNHGGDDSITNLAIACTRCNVLKGSRLDCRQWDDPVLQRVIATLQDRRAQRRREPPAWVDVDSKQPP
jgi:5-methylcytosine-specific restriction endonuclease McrA